MIKAIIVDDEVLALKNLSYALEQYENIEVLDMISSPLEALAKIMGLKPDVVFLDIEMPGINGFAVAEEILKVAPKTLIVFVTAYDEYAVQAFEVNALDYLLKPVTTERLAHTIDKIMDRYPVRQSKDAYRNSIYNASNMLTLKFDKVIAWKNNKIFFININEILYLTVVSGSVIINTENEVYRVKGTLNSWEERLSDLGFFRCHKSYLVNINKIAVISPIFKSTFSIKLENCKTDIFMSRRYAAKLKDILDI